YCGWACLLRGAGGGGIRSAGRRLRWLAAHGDDRQVAAAARYGHDLRRNPAIRAVHIDSVPRRIRVAAGHRTLAIRLDLADWREARAVAAADIDAARPGCDGAAARHRSRGRGAGHFRRLYRAN